MINPYIEKSKRCIKSIPRLKQDIQELSNSIREDQDKRGIRMLQIKKELLKHYIRILEELGFVGLILIEVYLNEKDNRIVANKYNISSNTVERYKCFSKKYNNVWQALAVLLYGIDALLLEKVDESLW